MKYRSGRPEFSLFIKVFPFLVIAVAALLLARLNLPVFLILGVCSSVYAAYRYLFIRRCLYVVTPGAVWTIRGFFFRKETVVQINLIETYIIRRSFAMRLFRLMDLGLNSKDTRNPQLWLLGMPSADIVEIIKAHVQAARKLENRLE